MKKKKNNGKNVSQKYYNIIWIIKIMMYFVINRESIFKPYTIRLMNSNVLNQQYCYEI